MLKLVLVGCGSSQRLAKYVHALQSDIYCFVKQYGFLIYDVNKFYRAEENFEELKTNSRLCFSSKKDTDTEYIGIIDKSKLYTYYLRWFKKNDSGFVFNKETDYSEANLRNLVKEWINNSTYTKNSQLFDMNIKYQYIKGNEKDVCLLEIHLNNSEAYPIPEDIFRNIIVKMDELFSDVFMSAYVTNAQTGVGEEYYQAYSFDFERLDSKIIYVGYILYISKKIEKASGFTRKDNLNQYSANLLPNGTLYTRNRITDGIEYLNNTEDLLFCDIIIPRYRVFNWSDFCIRKFFSISVYELVSIYYDPYSRNDPTVVLSYGYSYPQLDALPMLYDSICHGRYDVKELLRL